MLIFRTNELKGRAHGITLTPWRYKSRSKSRRLMLPFLAAFAMFGNQVSAQDYPTRTIRLIVPFTPGDRAMSADALRARHDRHAERADRKLAGYSTRI